MITRAFIFFFLISTLIIFTGLSMAKAQEYHSLPNGLEVIIDRDQRFPLVSMRLYVRAGSAYEQQGQEGISHFLEHMVFKGTQRRSPGQVAREIEEVGGYINAATSFDYTVYTVDLPSHQWKLGLDILQDMIFGSIFDPDELSQEINVVLAEIQRAQDNPGSRIFRSIQSMIFMDTPYEHPILGFKETVKEFRRDHLNNYVDHFYQPRSMVLAVSGNVESGEILDQVQKVFGSLENKTGSTLPAALDILSGLDKDPDKRVSLEHGPWSKAYMAMAVPAPELNSPKTAAFDILAYLLGGDRTSLLYREFKYDLGLVDQISSQTLSLERTGLMYFYTRMDPDEIEPFWEKFMNRMVGLNELDFTDEQIKRAVTNIEEELFRSRETLGGTASKLGLYQLFEGDPRAEEKYLHNLRRVSRDDLKNIMEQYLCPDNFVVAALIPEQVALSREVFTDSLKSFLCAGDIQEQLVTGVEDEKTEVIDLGHDRKLVIIHDSHLPHTSVSIAWPGGNSLVSPDEQGLPELSGGTLIRETRQRSFEQIQEFLRDRASSINASASRNSFSMSARFPTVFSQDILELLSEMILFPTFSQSELQRAASDQIAEIRQQEDRPTGYAFRHLFPFLFSSGTYSYLHLGEESLLLQITPEMVSSFWDKQRKMPFVISVCGSIDRQSLDNLVAALSEIEITPDKTVSDFIWSEQKTKDVILRDRAQAHVLMVFPIPGKEHEHTPALGVLNKALAGQGGILFRELRDQQGLAYSVTSLLWQSTNTGFLALYIGTYEDRVDEAVKGFEDVIARLRAQNLENEEVDRAANMIFGEYHRGRQTISSRSGEAASLLVQGLDLDFNLEMTELAGKVTPEELRNLAVEYLDPDKAYLMRVLPR
jgi:zinc protease